MRKDFDSYVAGVGSEGLQDLYEIKILICYLIDSVDFPLTKDQVNTIFQQEGAANYFKFAQAEQELISSGHLSVQKQPEGGECYVLEPLGKETAHKLQTSLPRSLRERVVRGAMNLQAKLKKERQIQTHIQKVEDGYFVECVIHDVGSDLFSLKLFAPDQMQAEEIKERFSAFSGEVYKAVIGLLTNHPKAVEEVLRKIKG